MTEEQIRAIVREEIQRALDELDATVVTSMKAAWAKGIQPKD